MKISNLMINNFKNFSGQNLINLDNDINIIYGDNGFGKSAFFEAIEWCLTGEIEKYKNLGDNDFDENDLINYHVKSSETLCSVEIGFGNNVLVRSFKILNKKKNGRTGLKIINKKNGAIIVSGKRDVDNFMKSDYLKSNNKNIEKFGEMVKSAYILSQDQISDFIFKENSEDRYKSISSIMGLQSSVNLITNLKKIKIDVDKQISFIYEKIEALKNEIEGSDKNRTLIDENEFLKYNTNLLIKSANKLKREEINKFKNINIINIEKNKNLLSIMNILINEKVYDLKLLNNRIFEDKEKLNNIQKIRYDIKNKINENKDILIKLESEKKNFFLLKNSLNEINSLKIKINESKLGYDTTLIKTSLKNKLKYQEQLYYTQDNYQLYKAAEKDVLEMPDKILKIDNEYIILKNEEIDIKTNLNKLNEISLSSKEKYLFELSKALKKVKIYITENDTNGNCPVCNSFVGDNIQQVIKDQIYIYDNIINSINTTSKMNELNKEEFKNKLDIVNIKINKLKSNKNELLRQLDIFPKQLYNIKENYLFIKENFSISMVDIRNELERLNMEIKKIQYVLELNINLNNLLNKNKHLTNIDDFKQIETENINEEILRIKLVNEDFEIELKKINFEIPRYEDKINEYKNYIDLFNNEEYRYATIKFDILKNELEIKNNEMNKSFVIFEKYERYLSNFEFNSNIDLNISNFKINIKTLKKKTTKLISINESISELLETTKTVFGEGIKDFLNKPESSVKKFFRYLNPIPTMNDLKFDGDGEALVVNVKCDCEDDIYRSVGKTLSSGQMNVLAIAIFLSINQSQKIYDLDFVALDDPIQNMDDVNQFSICDVLGQLNKQLIFSTHDADFVRLFIKKNEFKKERIQIIDLKSRYMDKDKINFIKFNNEVEYKDLR